MTDYIVVGAGPAGATFALAAASRGASVQLVGPTPRHAPHTLELLSGRARGVLQHLGLLARVTKAATPCAGVVGGWGAAGPIDVPAILSPEGVGWIVDRTQFDRGLLAAAVAAGATRVDATVRDVEPAAGGWRVRADESGQRKGEQDRIGVGDRWLSGGQVVLATGRSGRLVGRSGMTRATGHPLLAVVAWVDEALPDLGDRLRVDATDHGWWWALGRGSGTSLGFCSDQDGFPSGSDRIGAMWTYALRHMRWPAAHAVRPRLRCAFTGHVTDPCPAGMQVIGDAALAIDPLSGHGLTLSLESAWRAATDPPRYGTWLTDATSAHLAQERTVYATAGLVSAFWQRRT